jgi:hypothetical protein
MAYADCNPVFGIGATWFHDPLKNLLVATLAIEASRVSRNCVARNGVGLFWTVVLGLTFIFVPPWTDGDIVINDFAVCVAVTQ